MQKDNKAVVSWSGGKDSYYAAIQAKASGINPLVLLNVLNEEGQVSRSHGIPSSIIQAQAEAMKLPVKLVASSWQEYEQKFTDALAGLKKEYDLTHVVFGDIDLEEHKAWEEKVCSIAGLMAHLPLWLSNRKKLVLQMLDRGMKTMIVSCNEAMGADYLGRLLTPDLVRKLEVLGIDPCGEAGEFHTLVTNGEMFHKPISVYVANKIHHDNYWFASLELLQ